MVESRLTGSRIRERRMGMRVRQADLARTVGISPAYLNLIEHNKRRIGGKLLSDIARELQVEPAQLSEGAGRALVMGLQDAAVGAAEAHPETDRAEDFAARFPGWAGLLVEQQGRITDLAAQVAALSDRLTHEPELAASLHEVISSVAAIRSTAAILADTQDIDPNWRARFLRNMREEAQRLSGSAVGLVDYLDAKPGQETMQFPAGENLAALVSDHAYYVSALEGQGAGKADLDALLGSGDDPDRRQMLLRYLADARAMPAEDFRAEVTRDDDPCALAAAFGVPMDSVLRRMASLAPGPNVGLVLFDGTTALTFRRGAEGDVEPVSGPAHPTWPIFAAFARPAQLIEEEMDMPQGLSGRIRCRAIALPRPSPEPGAPVLYEATMLVERLHDVDAPFDEADLTPL